MTAPVSAMPSAAARARSRVAAPRRRRGARIEVRSMGSEPRLDSEEERAGRRVLPEVDPACDRLLTVVADLGIVAEVFGDEDQVPARQVEAHRLRPEEGVRRAPREIVGEPELTELEERRVLDERGRDARVAVVHDRLAGRRVVVRAEVVALVQRVRLILLDAALLPIPEHEDPEPEGERELVAERPAEVRVELAHVRDIEAAARVDARLADDLRDRTTRLNEELPEREAEAGVEGTEARERQREHLVVQRGEARLERPTEVLHADRRDRAADLDSLVLELAAVRDDLGEPGRRRRRARQDQIARAAVEVRDLEVGAAAPGRDVGPELRLTRRLGTDRGAAEDRARAARCGDAGPAKPADRRVGEERVLLAEERLVARDAVGGAELDVRPDADEALDRKMVGGRELGVEEELVRVAVGARLLRPEPQLDQQPVAEGDDLLLPVVRRRALVRVVLERLCR